MKNTFIYILIILAIGLIAFNATQLDFDALTDGESGTALIMIGASACAVVLMAILLVSLKIAKKVK